VKDVTVYGLEISLLLVFGGTTVFFVKSLAADAAYWKLMTIFGTLVTLIYYYEMLIKREREKIEEYFRNYYEELMREHKK